MDKSKIAIGVAILLSVVAIFTAFGKPKVIVEKTTETARVGALVGPDISSPYLSFGGVREWAYSTAAKSTGSTTCSFISPAATTSLVAASASFSRLASTTVVEIGYSASNSWSTTTLMSLSGASLTSLGGQIVASSTASAFIVPPQTYINTKIGAGDTAGTVTPVGQCKVVFREV